MAMMVRSDPRIIIRTEPHEMHSASHIDPIASGFSTDLHSASLTDYGQRIRHYSQLTLPLSWCRD